RQIDPARHDDRRHRDGQQTELDAEPRHFESVADRQEVRREQTEHGDFDDDDREQDRLGPRSRAVHAGRGRSARLKGSRSRIRLWIASTAIAASTIPPCSARSQYALTPANVSAGPTPPSSTTPSTVPATVPRPPVTTAPPTTAAAITCISR